MTGERVERPWGGFVVLHQSKDGWVKLLYVKPGQRLSLQSHKHRDEYWVGYRGHGQALVFNPNMVELPEPLDFGVGDFISIPRTYKHRLINASSEWLVVLEMAHGSPNEDDITRYEDDYYRG